MCGGRESPAAERVRGRGEGRGGARPKVADEVALETAQQTLRVARRSGGALGAVVPARAQAERLGRRAGTHAAVEVRGRDEEGVPDEKEQHEAGRRGRLDKGGASCAVSLRQASASELGVFGHNIPPAAATLKRRRVTFTAARGAEPGDAFPRNILTNGRTTEGRGREPPRVDTSLRAPIECRPCWPLVPFALSAGGNGRDPD